MNIKAFAVFALLGTAGVLTFTLSENGRIAPPADLRDAAAAPAEFDTRFPDAGKMRNADFPDAKAAAVAPAAPESSGLTSLITKWLALKGTMQNAELSLFSIEMTDKQYDERYFQNAMTELRECRESALEFNAMAAQALSITPDSHDNIIAAKLLLSAISDMTSDTDIPPPALMSVYNIAKRSRELKQKIQPHNDLILEIMDEVGKAGTKIMAFSGPLP